MYAKTMASVVVIFELASQKNCFLIRKGGNNSGKGESVQIQVFEASYAEGKKAYFSLFGGVLKSGDTVTINGLYAAKLGIKDLQQIVLKPVSCSEIHCQKVQVEPLSVDDWEILNLEVMSWMFAKKDLMMMKQMIHKQSVTVHDVMPGSIRERNGSTLENCLMNQVRVVWPGQVLPVWVEKSICVFITIGEIDPLGKFSLLGTNTTVIVTPKSRSLKRAGSQHQPFKMPYRQATQDQTDNSLLPDSPHIKPTPMLPGKEMHSPKKSQLWRQNTDKGRESSVRRQGLMGMLSSLFQNEPQPSSSEENDDHLNDMQTDNSRFHQRNLVYRIQSCNLVETLEEIKRNIQNRTFGDEVDYYQQPPVELLQPSTIYVSARDMEGRKSAQQNTSMNSKVFYAEFKKLPSVQDKKKAELEKKNKGVKDNSDLQSARPDDGSLLRCVVRVVTVDRTTCITDPVWRQAALVVLKKQDLVPGHAFIPMLLRRQLKLDSTGCAWVKAGNISFTRTAAVTIYPISIVPRQVDDFMLLSAFRQWVETVANNNHPLVIFHGMLVKFNVTEIEYVEAQLLLSTGSELTMLLSQSNVRLASITVQRGTKDAQLPDVLTPLLAYRKVKDFEPVVPSQTLDQLGGISGLTQGALRHLEVCLGSRPLPQKLFSDRPGLNHGLLLLTGPKGSGKTSLANALCRAMSQPPNLAAIFTMSCKPLRGKRVETIQSLFEAAFDEAAWRQPSVLLLDDLDVIAPATNNPASEMSGEALYAAKVAQVLEGLVKFEMRNFTRMAVIVTSRSRSSLHHSIVASRGLHFVQEVTAITPPDKVCRRELLCSILEMHSTVAVKATLENLNLDDLAERTEGFVARDLQVLVNRALHCHMADLLMTQPKEVVLEPEDFTAALDGFKPLAIRNVQLHTAGDLGWCDVGGLEEVKAVLIETLQWPSKYPLLFANCPLRLRSGLLLYGPPGTGKTLLAGAVAKECGLNFISIKGPELLSKYIGASEQSVRDLFNRAQSARPCILFFDEFDSIAPRRGHDSTGVTDRVVNQLLTQLDGVEGLQGVYVLGATSRPDLIDPALLRPGRLDKCLYCGIPTQEERRSILRALTRKMCLAEDVSLDDVADVCEDFTGADFKALLYNAQLQAINEYTKAEEQGLDDSIVRIQGSPGMCTLGWRPSIKFQPIRSPSAFSPTTRTARMGPGGDFGPGGQVEENKNKVIVACTDGTEIMVPGPGGDLSQVKGEDAAVGHKPKKPVRPPSDLQLTKDGVSSHHKSQAVTFFPTISDGPSVLSPQDEARYLSMVEQIRRRAKLKEGRTNLEKRRASSVLVKPSMLMPVCQKHLLTAAQNMRPSVSAAERQRYKAIYENFVSGRHGDFNAGDLLSGLRTTLA